MRPVVRAIVRLCVLCEDQFGLHDGFMLGLVQRKTGRNRKGCDGHAKQS